MRTLSLDQVTGHLKTKAEYGLTGEVIAVQYHWIGGDTIAISGELLRNLDERFVTREEDEIQFGPYRVMLVEWIEARDCYIAQRIMDGSKI